MTVWNMKEEQEGTINDCCLRVWCAALLMWKRSILLHFCLIITDSMQIHVNDFQTVPTLSVLSLSRKKERKTTFKHVHTFVIQSWIVSPPPLLLLLYPSSLLATVESCFNYEWTWMQHEWAGPAGSNQMQPLERHVERFLSTVMSAPGV